MTVTAAESDQPLVEALVVTLSDGRLGFSGSLAELAQLDAVPVRLTGGPPVSGTARLVRSGTGFEEVRGRTRQAEGRLARWSRRHDDAVVLVQPDVS